MDHCKTRILCTILALAAIFCAGFNEGGLGATLPDLAFQTSSTTAAISTTYSWRSAGSIIGSLVFGYLLDRFEGSLVLGTCLLGQGVMSLLTPWCPELIGLSLINAMSAFFTNGIVVGSCGLSFLLWSGGASASIIQTTRLSFSLGLAVAPVAIQPFLGINNGTNDGNDSLPLNCRETSDIPQCSSVYLAYTTFGILDLTLAILAFAVFCLIKYTNDQGYSKISNPDQPEQQLSYGTSNTPSACKMPAALSETSTENTDTMLHLVSKLKKKSVAVPFICILFSIVVYGGIEMVMNGLLVIYAQDYLNWSVEQSVLLLTVYQVTKLVTILPIVFLAKFINPFFIFLADVTLIGLASVILFSVINLNDISLWIVTVLIALGSSNVFATSLSYTNELIGVSGKITGSFNVAFALGGLSLPALCGFLLEKYGVLAFPGLLCVSSACLVAFVIISKALMIIFARNEARKVTTCDIDCDKVSQPLLQSHGGE